MTQPRLSHARTWRKSLSRTYGEEKARTLICAAQARYDALWAEHSWEENRANRIALKNRILPGLAIYQTLLRNASDRQKVLEEVDRLFCGGRSAAKGVLLERSWRGTAIPQTHVCGTMFPIVINNQ